MIVRRLAFAAILALPGSLAAQADPRPHACFQPRPADRCTWFPLIETGAAYRLTDVYPGDERLLLDWKLGFMANTGPRTAVGGLVFASAEGEFRVGAALRWRRWLTPRSSLDLQAGVHLVGDASAGDVAPGSPTVAARISAGDWIAATARFDLLRIRNACPTYPCQSNTTTSPRLYVGAETGGWGGVIGYAATGVVFVIALIALSHSEYF